MLQCSTQAHMAAMTGEHLDDLFQLEPEDSFQVEASAVPAYEPASEA